MKYLFLLIFLININCIYSYKNPYSDSKIIQKIWDRKDLQNSLKIKSDDKLINIAKEKFNLEKNNIQTHEEQIEYNSLNKYINNTLSKTNIFNYKDYINLEISFDLFDSYTTIFNYIYLSNNILNYNSMIIILPKKSDIKNSKVQIFNQKYSLKYQDNCILNTTIIKQSTYSREKLDLIGNGNIEKNVNIKQNKKCIYNISKIESFTKNLNETMNIFLLLSIKAISNTKNIPLSPTPLLTPSHWYKNNNFNTFSINSIDQAIKKIVNQNGKVGTMLKNTVQNKVISHDSCMGLENFDANSSVEIHQCIDKKYIDEFIVKRFDNITNEFFKGDADKTKSEMLAFEHDSADNFTKENIHFSNSETSLIRMLGVFKNIDRKNNCYNFFITNYYGAFNIAKDIHSWIKSSSGFFSKTSKTIVQDIPHKITIQDMKNLIEISYILSSTMIAQMRGISYEWPHKEMCS